MSGTSGQMFGTFSGTSGDFSGTSGDCVGIAHVHLVPPSSSCSFLFWGFTSPNANFLIVSQGNSSFYTKLGSICSCEPLDSSNVTSFAISTQPKVLLKM